VTPSPAPRPVLVRRGAIAIVVAQVLLWGWLTARGYFYLDDFELSGRAADAPGPSLTYLAEPHRGVLTPGARLAAWVLTHSVPLSWSAVAVTLVLGQLLVSLLALHLLRTLVGDVVMVLPALTVMVLSPIALPGALWWSTALLQLPQHLTTLGSLALAVRALRVGSARLAVASAVVVGAGALFSPRALLAAPLVLALTVAPLSEGPARARLATARRRWPLWTAHVAVVVLVVVAWSSWGAQTLLGLPTLRAVVEIGSEGLLNGTLPGLVGGPWTWLPTGYAGAVAAPGPVGVLAALAAVVAVVGLSVVWWRGAAEVWFIVAGYLAASVVWVAAGPDAVFGALVGDDYRTQGDLALVAGLGLALATSPVVVAVAGRVPRSLRPRPEGRAAVRRAVLVPLRAAGALPRRPGATGPVAAVTASVALGASAVVSTLAYAPTWTGNPARDVVRTTLSDLEALPDGARVVDSTVPYEVATPLIAPYNTTFHVFGPVLGAEAELRPGTATSLAVMPDPEGRLRQVAVAGATARSGPEPWCGWRVGNAARRIPFTGDSGEDALTVRLGVFAARPTALEVVVEGRTVTVDVPAGLGSVFTAAQSPVRDVTVRTVPEDTEVCIGDAQVGGAQLLPRTQP
jgi:hypothetical protein